MRLRVVVRLRGGKAPSPPPQRGGVHAVFAGHDERVVPAGEGKADVARHVLALQALRRLDGVVQQVARHGAERGFVDGQLDERAGVVLETDAPLPHHERLGREQRVHGGAAGQIGGVILLRRAQLLKVALRVRGVPVRQELLDDLHLVLEVVPAGGQALVQAAQLALVLLVHAHVLQLGLNPNLPFGIPGEDFVEREGERAAEEHAQACGDEEGVVLLGDVEPQGEEQLGDGQKKRDEQQKEEQRHARDHVGAPVIVRDAKEHQRDEHVGRDDEGDAQARGLHEPLPGDAGQALVEGG